MADLNALIPADSAVQLVAAVGLNEKGEIVAQGMLPNGDTHAFLLIPCAEGTERCGDAAESTNVKIYSRLSISTISICAPMHMAKVVTLC